MKEKQFVYIHVTDENCVLVSNFSFYMVDFVLY